MRHWDLKSSDSLKITTTTKTKNIEVAKQLYLKWGNLVTSLPMIWSVLAFRKRTPLPTGWTACWHSQRQMICQVFGAQDHVSRQHRVDLNVTHLAQLFPDGMVQETCSANEANKIKQNWYCITPYPIHLCVDVSSILMYSGKKGKFASKDNIMHRSGSKMKVDSSSASYRCELWVQNGSLNTLRPMIQQSLSYALELHPSLRIQICHQATRLSPLLQDRPKHEDHDSPGIGGKVLR